MSNLCLPQYVREEINVFLRSGLLMEQVMFVRTTHCVIRCVVFGMK